MSYQAIARKYRPETFAEVVGQTHVTGTLRAALRKGKLSHAYLFSGPRGCGKTTVARLLAKAINCTSGPKGDPCGECATCTAIAKGSYLDVLEIDAASNTGVDNVRELRDMAQYSPSEGNSRVFIIDEVHMLSKGAFNALLKILEEPPSRVFFFFATTEPNKIPRTILSRCQRFDFRLLSRDELGARMQEIATAEGVELAETGQRLLVSLAEGSVRDGLSLLDQVIAGTEGPIDEEAVVQAFGLVRSELYLELNEAIIARDPARALRLVETLATTGQSLDVFARDVVINFRNLLLLKIDPDLGAMVDVPPDQAARLLKQAGEFSEQDLLALIDRSGRHFERIHRSTQPRIFLEASLVEYCHFESRVLLSELAHRLEALGGTLPAAGSGAGSAPARGGSRPVPPARGSSGGMNARPAARADEPVGYSQQPPAVTAPSPAADEAVPGWTGLIDRLMGTNPRIGSCLMKGLPEWNEEQTVLTVTFGEDTKFALDSIQGECDRIQEIARECWKRSCRFVLKSGNSGQSEQKHEEIRQQVAPTRREELDQACREDKQLGDLVDLIGGKPLPETDRDRWDPPKK